MSAPHSPSSINQGALRPSNAVSQISRYFLMDDVPQEGKVLQHDILPNSVTSISIMLQYTTVWASHRLILGLSKVPHPFSLVSLCSWQYNIQSSPKTRNLFFFVFDTEGLFSCTPLTYFSSNLTLITLNNPISYHRILSFFPPCWQCCFIIRIKQLQYRHTQFTGRREFMYLWQYQQTNKHEFKYQNEVWRLLSSVIQVILKHTQA